MRILLPALILLLISCKCPKKLAGNDAEQTASHIKLTQLLVDNYGGTEEESLEVIRSQGELQKFFSRVNRTRKPGLPVPEVNFEDTMVLIYSPGSQRGDEAPNLELDKNEGNTIYFYNGKSGGAPSDTKAYTTPFAVYSLPITSKEILLVKDKSPK